MAPSSIVPSSSLLLDSVKGIRSSVKCPRYAGSAGYSRSTSAGSLPSDGQDSAPLQKSNLPSPAYPGSCAGLPEYDYPAPWSIERAQLPEVDYPAPVLVKNTFIGFDVLRPASLAEFFEERKTQSCPASGISLPPGLEDVIEPEEAAGNLVAAESAIRSNQIIEDPNWAESSIPTGLLDSLPVAEAPRFPSSSPEPPPLAHADMQTSWADKLRFQHSFDLTHTPAPVCVQLADALPMPPDPCLFFRQDAQSSTQPPEPALGSTELPTIGSQGHNVGMCKPCAFFHTKGCGNGVQCPFCHLCDAGEKKRRAKDKRDMCRALRKNGY